MINCFFPISPAVSHNPAGKSFTFKNTVLSAEVLKSVTLIKCL